MPNTHLTQDAATVAEAERQARSPLEPLRAFGEALWNASLPGQISTAVRLTTDPGSVFRDTAIPIIRFILYALQWGFVNILEAALLLTALFAPMRSRSVSIGHSDSRSYPVQQCRGRRG